MASDRYMPEDLHWAGVGIGALSIGAAIAFALAAAYAVTHVGIDGPQPWTGAQPGTPPPIQGSAILQPDPAQDIRVLVAEKRTLLEGYAWVDGDHTIARIPIDRAMEIVASHAAERKP